MFRMDGDEMAGKDATEKILEAYNDVFSDIVNVVVSGRRSPESG